MSSKFNEGFSSDLPEKDVHLGDGDTGESPAKKKRYVVSNRSTFPTTNLPGSARKQRSKFTISSSISRTPIPSALPTKSLSTSCIPELKLKFQAPEKPFALMGPPPPVLIKQGPKRKSTLVASCRTKTYKPRKSKSMLEIRRGGDKPNRSENIDFFDYPKQLESVADDGLDDKYKYLAYKTYCFMLKNAWKKAKEERQILNETVKNLQNSVLKTKTQLHVIKSLYHVERKHFDESRMEVRDLQQKLTIEEAQLQELKLNSEKLTLDYGILKAEFMSTCDKLEQESMMGHSLNRSVSQKDDELVQLKKDNGFLIKQRQEMEAGFIKKLNAYKEIIQNIDTKLLETTKENHQMQKDLDRLYIKEFELEEYREINAIQLEEIDNLVETIDKMQFKNRVMKVVSTLDWQYESKRFIYLLFATFVPGMPMSSIRQ